MTLDENQHTGGPNDLTLLRYLTEETSDAETAVVESWVKRRPENKKLLTQMACVYHAQKTHNNIRSRDPHQAFDKVQRRIQRNVRTRVLKRIAVAASLVIGLLGIGIFFFNQPAVEPQWITIYAKTNLRSTFSLPDGTKVQLNSGSSLTYPSAYTGNERTAKLEGEAFFDVAPNAKRPFVVRVADDRLAVRVLGTQFTVSAYPEEEAIQTTLLSGSVQVEIPEANLTRVLKPAEKAYYMPKDKQVQVMEADIDRETDWMHNKLVFRATPMREVLDRLARYYDVEFDIKDNVIYGYTFTGSFENKPLHQVLDYMRLSSKIKYVIRHKKATDTKMRVELHSER